MNDLKKMEIQMNIKKMEASIMEKEYQKLKLHEDIKRIDDHIKSLKQNKSALEAEFRGE